jgi:D-alanyl-D-alanine carboxypeptidase (penicillin-binding protein 5/6)
MRLSHAYFFSFLFYAIAATDACAAALETRAEYAVLMDAETRIVLFEKDGDKPMVPASMSKLMTLTILFDKLKVGSLTLDDKFFVSEKAWRMGGSEMFVLVDTEIRIEDLIRGIIVHSGNDACIVVAEGISGTEEAFAREMTRLGHKIGLQNSTFANSTGWPDPDQKMSARDLAVLVHHIIQEYPEYYSYYAEKEFSWSGITQPNRNPLLYADLGADGLKTGHTAESGYGLAASAVQDGRRLILVVNGLSSESERSRESQRLLRAGFRDFNNYDLFQGGDIVGKANVWQGANGTVDLQIQDPLTVILRPEDRRDMKVTITYRGPIPAPITEGQEIAELRVIIPDSPDIVRPLYAGKDVGSMAIFGKLASAAIHLITERLSSSSVDSP